MQNILGKQCQKPESQKLKGKKKKIHSCKILTEKIQWSLFTKTFHSTNTMFKNITFKTPTMLSNYFCLPIFYTIKREDSKFSIAAKFYLTTTIIVCRSLFGNIKLQIKQPLYFTSNLSFFFFFSQIDFHFKSVLHFDSFEKLFHGLRLLSLCSK